MREPRPTPSARRLLRALLLGLALSTAAAHAIRIAEIPSPRPAGWSVDLTGRVPKETLAEIDRLGDEVKAKNGAELAVVVVGTTGGVPSHPFATDLFNTWHIGQRDKNNGVLLFVALDDHRIEIVLGRGLSSPAAREASAEIVKNDMVPRLRQGDPGGAVLAGARATAQQLLDVASADAAAATETGAPSEATAPLAALPSSGSTSVSHDAVQPPAPQLPAPSPGTDPPVATFDSSNPLGVIVYLLFFCVLGGVGVWFFYPRPPRCPRCHAIEKRLSPEDTAAAFPLTAVEQTEARLGSVTIEAYRCPACGELEKVRHSHPLSGYESCPDCTAVALSRRRWTVRRATYGQEGLVETEWRCQHCPYQSSSTTTTPRLVRQVALDSSDSYSSSSSYSSSDSSSSSSDSGFSGGSSSGDGASGSW